MQNKDINDVIAANLKKFRNENNLSLDEVAKLTGVSKSMINRIESLKSVPSVTVLWKIANGLKISFSMLMEEKTEDNILLEKKNIKPLSDKNYHVYTYIPYDSNSNIEMFYIELEAHSIHTSKGHEKALFEYVFSLTDTLEISLNNDKETTKIQRENMFKFDARKEHSYHNNSNEKLNAIIVITYK